VEFPQTILVYLKKTSPPRDAPADLGFDVEGLVILKIKMDNWHILPWVDTHHLKVLGT